MSLDAISRFCLLKSKTVIIYLTLYVSMFDCLSVSFPFNVPQTCFFPEKLIHYISINTINLLAYVVLIHANIAWSLKLLV